MAILMVFRGSRTIVSPSLPRHLTELTSQERQILREITQRGKLPRAAERLGISEAELMEIIIPLTEKLELQNPEGLVRWAKKHGF
jgi:DNA-binding NarL/FixJ family response regulator